jgi:iron(III) transport system permease protein
MFIPFRRIAEVFAALPLAMPPLIGAAAFFFLFSESGLLPRIMELLFSVPASSFRIEGFWAVVAIHAYSFYVFFYFLVDDALRTLDGSEIESAQLLGAGTTRIFFRVIVPHITPALVRTGLLVFISSLASFSAPLLFGGGMRFMTTEIYNAKLNGSFADAAAYSTLLSVFSIGVLFAVRGSRAGMKRTGKAYIRKKRSRADAVLAPLTWVFLLAMLLPFIMLIILAFATEGEWTTQLLPPAYTFGNFTSIFSGGDSFRPLATSIMLGLATVGITTLVGICRGAQRDRGMGKEDAGIFLHVPDGDTGNGCRDQHTACVQHAAFFYGRFCACRNGCRASAGVLYPHVAVCRAVRGGGVCGAPIRS